jgi:hypothetical protein
MASGLKATICPRWLCWPGAEGDERASARTCCCSAHTPHPSCHPSPHQPPQVIERLTERRIAVEKAVTTLGEAPSGLRDVFELCRGFERAFSNIVNESPAANKIKEAFFSEKGLAGNVQKLPLEKVFELESVKKVRAALRLFLGAGGAGEGVTANSGRSSSKSQWLTAPSPHHSKQTRQITKTADGYQPHLVSPERGLRLMATRALDQVEGPVTTCVSAVYSMLVSAAREAAAGAGEHTEAAMSGKVPLNVPEFKNFIMPAVVRALDDWRNEAEKSELLLLGGGGRGETLSGSWPASRYRWTATGQKRSSVEAPSR